MTEAQQIKIIVTGLQAWGRAHKATVSVAHDLNHMILVLGSNPGTLRAAVLVVREVPRDEANCDVIGRMDREFWIGLSRGYELESVPGKSLTDGIAGGEPMYALLASCRTALKALRFEPSDEPVPYYHGYDLMTVEGIKLDAYKLKIKVAADTGDETENDSTDA